ncbi:hypothetical protein Apa02nite_089890 [Actinoplanes palleronii]|uniref:Uncharacterized protein n=1 Tax=Actinoplanes palleronii TaxID=113570 RepID=A0ABQ4BRF3_9ACTN|nr:hypothetical protein Apa02nite_089890 [Actinoplanes palleronii]
MPSLPSPQEWLPPTVTCTIRPASARATTGWADTAAASTTAADTAHTILLGTQRHHHGAVDTRSRAAKLHHFG